MAVRKFSQIELNHIVAARVCRERDSLVKDFENRMKRIMASLHLMLHQELCTMKREMADNKREMSLPLSQTNEVANSAGMEYPAKHEAKGR